MGGRIDCEPPVRDRRPACGAPAVLVFVHPPERRLDPRTFELAAALGLLRHLLSLHQVHAREAAHGLLIELHSRAFVGSRRVERAEFIEALRENPAPVFDVSVQNV